MFINHLVWEGYGRISMVFVVSYTTLSLLSSLSRRDHSLGSPQDRLMHIALQYLRYWLPLGRAVQFPHIFLLSIHSGVCEVPAHLFPPVWKKLLDLQLDLFLLFLVQVAYIGAPLRYLLPNGIVFVFQYGPAQFLARSFGDLKLSLPNLRIVVRYQCLHNKNSAKNCQKEC